MTEQHHKVARKWVEPTAALPRKSSWIDQQPPAMQTKRLIFRKILRLLEVVLSPSSPL